MSTSISAPRGTHDVLPGEIHKWRYIEHVARATAEDFSFSEIRFPTFEHTELFHRGVGDSTDVVQKEMYTFDDRGGRSISLRPEGTASVVRSFIENSLYGQGLPLKMYYICPNFRYEKPQAGRLREHHQFGIEYFGSPDPASDAEVIGLADTYLRRAGVKNISLEINSLGCPNCRPAFHSALKDYFSHRMSALCPTCNERLEKNPLRILDCKDEGCKELSKDAPAGLDFLCDDCSGHFEGLKAHLGAMDISFEVNPRIVRGLDYYTKTVFEFVSTQIGAQGTVCGGGRYDGLVSSLGGPPTPGLGFGSGIERILMVLEAEGVEIPPLGGPSIFIASLGDGASLTVQSLVHQLRKLGVSAERDTLGRSLKAQMKYANKIMAGYSAVLGDDELGAGVFIVKNMATGEQEACKIDPVEIAKIVM